MIREERLRQMGLLNLEKRRLKRNLFSKCQAGVEKTDLDIFGRHTLKEMQAVDTKLQKWRSWFDIKGKKS